MRPLMLIGAMLVALGVVALLARGGIPYRSHKDIPSDGKNRVGINEEKVLTVPPLVAGAVIVVGAGLMVVAARKPR